MIFTEIRSFKRFLVTSVTSGDVMGRTAYLIADLRGIILMAGRMVFQLFSGEGIILQVRPATLNLPTLVY